MYSSSRVSITSNGIPCTISNFTDIVVTLEKRKHIAWVKPLKTSSSIELCATINNMTPTYTNLTEIFELIEQVSLKVEQLSNSPLNDHPLFEIFKRLKMRMSNISKSRLIIVTELKKICRSL